jgi:hypothetical protein
MTSFIREPEYADYEWMCEAFKDWPKGVISNHTVSLLLRRWIERKSPICRVLVVDDEPRCLIAYKIGFFSILGGIAVTRPEYRKQGFYAQAAQLIREEVEPQGVVVARVLTIPGSPIDGRYPDNLIAIGDPL